MFALNFNQYDFYIYLCISARLTMLEESWSNQETLVIKLASLNVASHWSSLICLKLF